MHPRGCCRGISPVSGVNGNVVLQLLETRSLPPSLIIRATLKKTLVNEIWNHSPTPRLPAAPSSKRKNLQRTFFAALYRPPALGCAAASVCTQAGPCSQAKLFPVCGWSDYLKQVRCLSKDGLLEL